MGKINQELYEATNKSPVFCKLTSYEGDVEDNLILACTGVQVDAHCDGDSKYDTYLSDIATFRVIKSDTKKAGEYMSWWSHDEDWYVEIIPTTQELTDIYWGIVKEMKWTVEYDVYPEMPDLIGKDNTDHKFLSTLRDVRPVETIKVALLEGIYFWEDVERWICENLPEYYYACGWWSNNGNFMARSSFEFLFEEYGDKIATKAGRARIAEKKLKELEG